MGDELRQGNWASVLVSYMTLGKLSHLPDLPSFWNRDGENKETAARIRVLS
jgi:hypothetical protein